MTTNNVQTDRTFERLVEPHRTALRLHCYRMLGSSCDSEDMVQETLARAFRAKETLREAAAVRGWLYRIATNACLDELGKRPQPRARGPELGPASDPDEPNPPGTPADAWIEPCPSAWLDPAAQYAAKENVALAFVAALQVLTPPQRAVLLLRDVVGLSAEETADALSCTVSAANSTLHRARTALETRVGPRAEPSASDRPTGGGGPQAIDRALLERYLRAWESGDLAVIISLLHEEATLSMPPVPKWIAGRDAIAHFLRKHALPNMTRRVYRAIEVGANGTPAAGFYREGRFFALQLFELRDGRIKVIDHFMTPSSHAAFFAAGLAQETPPR
jgi:RNA polymerase sigma-70 factor, ECF subfamily